VPFKLFIALQLEELKYRFFSKNWNNMVSGMLIVFEKLLFRSDPAIKESAEYFEVSIIR